jgi:hypothetical protein
VSIKRSGYKSYSQRIEIQSKTEVTMRAKLEKDPSRMDAVLAYLFTAAFVGGGYYLGTKADDLEQELRAEIDAGNPPPDSEDPRYLRGKIYAITADSAYAIGGMTFLAAIYYTLRDKGKPSTGSSDIRAITFEPSIAPDYAGLGLQVSF